MSIDYGNCNAYECWYARNKDRLNEYCEDDDVNCVSNVDYTDAGLRYDGINIGKDPYGPWSFTLCEVCYANSSFKNHGKCSVCGYVMLDKGLTIGDDVYCRNCMDIPKLSSIVETHVPEYIGVDADPCDWDLVWDITWEDLRNNKVDPKLIDVIKKAIDAHNARKKKRAIEEKIEKVQKKRKTEGAIHKLIPGVPETTCKRICQVFELEKAPSSLNDLLKIMVQRHAVYSADI